jgi:isoleucyl-tRNA synthetase
LSLAEVALPEGADAKAVELQKSVIAEELNVKEVRFMDLSSVGDRVKKVLKPNAKILGPKFGSLVQDIIKEAREGRFQEENGEVVMTALKVGEGNEVRLTADEFVLETMSSGNDPDSDATSERGVTVILHTKITDELLSEGHAREVVRVIQDLRKEADYSVSDHIILDVTADKLLAEAVTKHADYIMKETLADELIQKGDMEWDKEILVEIDFHKVKVAIKKAC